MERRHTDGIERTVEENVRMIAEAGYDGISTHCTDPAMVARVAALIRPEGLAFEGQCFPKTVDDLKPVLDLAVKHGVRHLDLQPDIRPRTVAECVPLLEGWLRLGEEAGISVYIETHRDRMTTDLHFVLDLLDAVPGLPLLADLSHFLVGREFAWPVPEEEHAKVRRVLDQSWGLHGRVGTREQVQIELSFPHHRPWLDLFLEWWEYGMRSWSRRAAASDTLTFTCELGPKPYAITGPDGNDTTDRWHEALLMRDAVGARWEQMRAANPSPA
jgi:hypothetical protein